MTIAIGDILALDEPADFQRDRYERPLIVPPNGGAPIPYTRASSAAKTIDDTYHLELWNRRNVAYGLAHDASLVARVLAVGGTPYTWEQAEKAAVNKITDDALKAAQAHKGADIGTALHRLTEMLDRGDTVSAGPYQADLDAYTAALADAGFSTSPEWIECRIVCDPLQMAGTADRILTRGDEHFIADLKTGSHDHGLTFAAQLAAYANGTLYDPTIEKRLDTPELNKERGVIIHLPAGAGECTLYWIDLRAGYEAARFANEIRAMRSASSKWLTPLEVSDPALIAALAESLAIATDSPVAPLEQIETEAAALRQRLNAAVDTGARRMVWPEGVAKFKDGGPVTWTQLLAVETCVLDAEREAEMPFATRLPEDPTPRPALSLVQTSGSGVVASSVAACPAPGDTLDRLKAMHEALPIDLQQAAYGAVIAAGVSSDRRTWTTDEFPTIERILASAISQHDSRKRRINQILQDCDDIAGPLVRCATGAATQDKNLTVTIESLDGDEVNRLEALVDALGTAVGVSLDAPDEMHVVVLDLAEQLVIDTYGGSKAEALAAAKSLATIHGRPKPRSVAQAVTDPVLVALLIADD